jgi:bifunctional UDP-N-acetylglucosamine pyrophosphorylase/glucosamine-1-phosphate N-acetyltransferase
MRKKMKLSVVIMAGGMGTRMKSKRPKVLHPLLGQPLLSHVLRATQPLHPAQTVVIVGHEAEQVKAGITQEGVAFALQSPQLGTGHAVMQARTLLEGQGEVVLVIPSDLPLLTTATFRQLITAYEAGQSPLVMLTVKLDNPRGFGRIVRDEQGQSVRAIVEEAACTPAQRTINELNVGAYLFNAAWLWQNLAQIPLSPKGEYYLTDLVEIAVQQGHPVRAETLSDPTEALGINDRVHLAEAEAALRRRVNQAWMRAGVTLIDPATTTIGLEVTLEPDTIIYPNTHLLGHTTIGEDCVIGPHSYIADSRIGPRCVVRFAVVEEAVLEHDVDIGPFAHLRKGAHLAEHVHMGNFGEVKNSYLGPGTKMGHFSYLGDITTGHNVNIGAGTITCNYDGVKKHPTIIGDNTFIGSDTMLVAPLKIGRNAKTGAGSVVTRDIPDDALAYGTPARIKKES